MSGKSTTKFHVIPRKQSPQDFVYKQQNISFRSSVDLREWDSTVENQGFLGSCVSNSLASAYEIMVKILYPDKFVNLSRLFIYYNSRMFYDTLQRDTGIYIKDGIKSLYKYGACDERLWPYDIPKFNEQPEPRCYVDAAKRCITSYETLYTLKDMIEVLNLDKPIVSGMSIYESFSYLTQEDSIVKLPSQEDEFIGTHSVTIVGYDIDRKLFLAKNSFGDSWGDLGYCWIPFEYVRSEVFEQWCFEIPTQ